MLPAVVMASPPRPSTDPELRRKFRELYSFYIPQAHRSFYSPGDLELFLNARLNFSETFAGEIKLRVSNPPAEFFWLVNSTIIEVVLPDSRFIVDTLIDYCAYRGFRINLILHPVFATRRDARGRLIDIRHADDPETQNAPWSLESCVYLEVSRLDAQGIRAVERDLRANIEELRAVVGDYPGMAAALRETGPNARDQTEWMLQHFIMLGLAEIKTETTNATVRSAQTIPATRAGIFKHAEARTALEAEAGALIAGSRTEESRKQARAPFAFRETRIFSNVNRRKPYYLVLVEGRVLIAGHFASGAELQLRQTIPMIAPRLEAIARRLHAGPTSYTKKKILQIAQMIPLGLLLTRAQIFESWMELVLASEYTDELEYIFSVDRAYESVWIAAIVPGRDADQIPGRQLARLLDEHKIETHHDIRYPLNRNQFILLGLRGADGGTESLHRLIESQAGKIFSSWSVRFRRLIGNKYVGDRNISAKLDRFFRGIAPDYEHHQEPEEALYDLDTLENFETIAQGDRYRIHFYAAEKSDFVKLYALQRAPFSEIVPILSNFGFEIFEEFTLPYQRSPDDIRFTYAFRVAPHPELSRSDRDRIAAAIENALNRRSVPQPLDALVITAGLSVREMDLLKALLAYFFQIERGYSRLSLQATLLKYPQFARALVELFHARMNFGPAEGASNATESAAEKNCAETIDALLNSVESIVDETLLHKLARIVNAIVRTTYYLQHSEIAFKIDTHSIDFVPAPVPFFEIFVYGYNIEGTHLRGGAVARGGLRWSDRADDYRTEILGLMKAQMVKNTVIVPVGSKGGFIIKNRSFADRAEFLAAGVDTYRRYISALLDLTDSLTPAGKTIPARGIRRRDGDDPYLVVAADKGTATFSDIANEISIQKKFWLTDAFASGGANGYDHKKQGITAKGAWEAVRRHFYELDQDPERDPIRAVGIGDMSGDVFGNGLLLSRSLKLIAAFNHLYIFLDPDPDVATAFAERERLFQAGGNWDAYDTTLISKGGGVFERQTRRVNLSAEIRAALGIKETALSGESLIQAILKAPVDLLWNGGIGTYVKSASEDHFAARDPANDRVRVNGMDLRAKVVGEGGNLGFTQAGRIEASARGTRLNTDAIDNSAGVNMSDHEVNLKIFLDQLLRKKKIPDLKTRNAVIRKYDPAMIQLVLESNKQINLALSLDELRTPRQFSYLRVLIKNLNRAGYLNREADNIPFEADLDQLEHTGRRLPRPVLCSLMGFTKLQLSTTLLASNEFHNAWFDRYIVRYFPEGLVRDYPTDILKHPLKREIVITEALNAIVNHAGIVLFQRMRMRTDAREVDIALAYLRFSEFADLPALRKLIAPEIPARVYYEYQIVLEEMVFSIVRRLLEQPTLLAAIEKISSEDFRALLDDTYRFSTYRMPRDLRGELRALSTEDQEHITAAFRRIDVLEDAFIIFERRRDAGRPVAWTVKDFFRTIEVYRIDRLRMIARDLPHESNWEILFHSRIEDAIEELLFSLVESGAAAGQRKSGGASNGDGGRNKQALETIDQALALHAAGNLSAAAFFEMLEHLRLRILTSTRLKPA